ncbi:hypothetical protein [Crossiella sp. NPDC003009]
MRDLVARAVPASVDRLDLATLDRPLRGLSFDRFAGLGRYLRDYIEQDLARRSDPAFSTDLGAFLALLSGYGQLPRLLASGRLSARSQVEEFDGWWAGFCSFYTSGPPGDPGWSSCWPWPRPGSCGSSGRTCGCGRMPGAGGSWPAAPRWPSSWW